MLRGLFITLEGVDGAGKSTHLPWLRELFEAHGKKVRTTREPGGTPLGERLRELLLSAPMHVETEALLLFAARREHLARVIEPALEAGEVILSDRFTDATYAYQCGGRGLPETRLKALEAWVQGPLQPDLTLLFDVAGEVAEARRRAVREPDRFERERADFYERVRQAYLQRAAQYPERIKVIDANQPVEAIRKQLLALLEPML